MKHARPARNPNGTQHLLLLRARLKELSMLDRLDDLAPCCPCLVLAHSDAVYTALASRALRLRGWDVYTARTGPEARRLARMLNADLVILSTELVSESGWLTCAKLVGEMPMLPVVLVAPDADPRTARLASFVGSSDCVDRREDIAALMWQAEEACMAIAE
jgi:DNA-binding NtrC family response regulator